MAAMTSSSSSRSSIRSCAQRVARLPTVTSWAGWKCDISGVRRYEDLPKEARDYVEYIEREIGCPITYVSVGAERDAIILR